MPPNHPQRKSGLEINATFLAGKTRWPFGHLISPGDPAQSELWSQSWGREAPWTWGGRLTITRWALIIPFSKWLIITMFSKSPKWGYSPSKWPKWTFNDYKGGRSEPSYNDIHDFMRGVYCEGMDFSRWWQLKHFLLSSRSLGKMNPF